VLQEWTPEELIESWTLVTDPASGRDDGTLVGNKAGPTRLGFALLLKFYELGGRFPAYPKEVPPAAVAYVAGLVKVPAEAFATYSWTSRSIEYHRAQIRSPMTNDATHGQDALVAGATGSLACPRSPGLLRGGDGA
jgi:hypothetical protein